MLKARAYNNIATVRDKQGRGKEALENMEQALSILRQCLPPTHPEIAASLSNIATFHYKNQQYLDAMQYCKECLLIQEASLPSHHSDIVRTTSLMEEILRQSTPSFSQYSPAGEKSRRSILLAWALFCLVVSTIVVLPVFLYILWRVYHSGKPFIH
jgi:tetratricopeptide (TPR) repeat protein